MTQQRYLLRIPQIVPYASREEGESLTKHQRDAVQKLMQEPAPCPQQAVPVEVFGVMPVRNERLLKRLHDDIAEYLHKEAIKSLSVKVIADLTRYSRKNDEDLKQRSGVKKTDHAPQLATEDFKFIRQHGKRTNIRLCMPDFLIKDKDRFAQHLYSYLGLLFCKFDREQGATEARLAALERKKERLSLKKEKELYADVRELLQEIVTTVVRSQEPPESELKSELAVVDKVDHENAISEPLSPMILSRGQSCASNIVTNHMLENLATQKSDVRTTQVERVSDDSSEDASDSDDANEEPSFLLYSKKLMQELDEREKSERARRGAYMTEDFLKKVQSEMASSNVILRTAIAHSQQPVKSVEFVDPSDISLPIDVSAHPFPDSCSAGWSEVLLKLDVLAAIEATAAQEKDQ